MLYGQRLLKSYQDIASTSLIITGAIAIVFVTGCFAGRRPFYVSSTFLSPY